MEKFGQLRHGDLWLSGEGTELGLPLTKDLVGAHGGSLEIEIDKGSKVTFSLPKQRVLERNSG